MTFQPKPPLGPPPPPPSAEPQQITQYPFRLLDDEQVLAYYPITSRQRPLGKLVSFLFVTDARVVYAAEAKTVLSSSTELREFRLDKVEGLEASRHRGLSALGVGVAVAVILNIILVSSIGAALVSTFDGLSSIGTGMSEAPSVLPGLSIGALFLPVIIVSVIVGVIVIWSLCRSQGSLAVAGARQLTALGRTQDWLTIVITVGLFLLFGLLIGIGFLAWLGARALGIFRAHDAFIYADARNIDAIAYDAGAVIIAAQTRGTLPTG